MDRQDSAGQGRAGQGGAGQESQVARSGGAALPVYYRLDVCLSINSMEMSVCSSESGHVLHPSAGNGVPGATGKSVATTARGPACPHSRTARRRLAFVGLAASRKRCL